MSHPTTGVESRCPSCGSPWQVFSVSTGVPVSVCLLMEDAAAARAVPIGDLLLAHCSACGFIGNAAHDPALVVYDADYEETQGCSQRFRRFAEEVAARWVERYELHERDVLEIGCGKGEFLGLIAELGGNRCVGLDPAVDLTRAPVPQAGSVELRAERFDASWSAPAPDAVVCRHTLEHIGPVAEFLTTLRAKTAHHTVVLFEVPDAGRVLRQGAVEDVYYEHCSYFTAGSLSRLFRRCGFEVLDVTLAYDDQYLLLEARPGEVDDTRDEQDEADLAETADAVASYRGATTATARAWRDLLDQEQAAGRRTVLWGGGSKAVAFLTTLGLGDAVEAVVDINPVKQGKAIPGTGHPVVAPERLVAAPPDLVVVMNAVYLEEITQALTALGLTPRVLAMGPTPEQPAR